MNTKQKIPSWQYDESQHTGADFSSREVVAVYDAIHRKFRDVDTGMALHHLPDFWKQRALNRLNGMLKKGGRLYLADVVISEKRCEANIEKWIRDMGRRVGSQMRKDARRHIRQEHSTYTWIMEGLLERAGFRIDRAKYHDGMIATYLCTKMGKLR